MLMRRFSKRAKRLSVYISVLAGFSLTILTLLANVIAKAVYPFPVQNLILSYAVATVLPPLFINFLDTRWRRAVDENMPKLVSEVAEDIRRGVNIVRAVELASDRKLGPLTSELKKVKVMLSWGLTFDEAVERMLEKVDTPLATRTFTLFAEMNRVGGDVRSVLETLERYLIEFQRVERERRASLRPYLFITYIAFGVFLLVTWLIYKSFFVEIVKSSARLGEIGFLKISVDLNEIKNAFLQLCIIEAVFGGIAAGKLAEESYGAGVKHILILLASSLIVFYTLF
jgi:flagellar protein FlaJ